MVLCVSRCVLAGGARVALAHLPRVGINVGMEEELARTVGNTWCCVLADVC